MKLGLPVVVTPSRIELGSRCHRRHSLNDLLNKAKFYSPSLEFGSVVHSGAGAWWNSSDASLVDKVVKEEWFKRFDMNPVVSQKDVSLELALAMLETYKAEATLVGPFTNEASDWKLVSVEERLEVPLAHIDYDPNGVRIEKKKYILSLQTDRVVYSRSVNHLVIIDTKTSGRMDKRWRSSWEMSLQLKLYKWAMQEIYQIDNVDVIVEGVEKEVRGKLEYVTCPEWSNETLIEAVQQAIAIAKKDECVIVDHDPVDYALNRTEFNPQDCFSYGYECPFRRLCLAEPEMREMILMSEYFNIESEY